MLVNSRIYKSIINNWSTEEVGDFHSFKFIIIIKIHGNKVTRYMEIKLQDTSSGLGEEHKKIGRLQFKRRSKHTEGEI